MNSMLLLAILSASLSALNMMLINLRERSRELLLLRAIGATRRQVGTMITTEGALYGFLGALVGLFTGAGVITIYISIAGGNMFGFPDFPVVEATLNTLMAALPDGLLALIAAPALTAIACLPTLPSGTRRKAPASLRDAEH
jgi:putative ABC transport system permease protein